MKRIIAVAVFMTLTLSAGLGKGSTIDAGTARMLHLQNGRTYAIDFFASWCHSCKREVADLSKVNGRGVTVIGVDIDQKAAEGKRFQASMRKAGKLRYRVVNDFSNRIIGRFNPPGVPAVYVVRDRKVLGAIIGAKNNIGQHVLRYAKGH